MFEANDAAILVADAQKRGRPPASGLELEDVLAGFGAFLPLGNRVTGAAAIPDVELDALAVADESVRDVHAYFAYLYNVLLEG